MNELFQSVIALFIGVPLALSFFYGKYMQDEGHKKNRNWFPWFFLILITLMIGTSIFSTLAYNFSIWVNIPPAVTGGFILGLILIGAIKLFQIKKEVGGA